MGSLIESFQGRIRDLFKIRTLPRKRLLRGFMGSTRLLLADVGATGNPKGVWREASEFSTFILFDPDPRAAMSSGYSSLVYSSGLWSGRSTKTLYCAVNPEASSIYEFNESITEDYLNRPLHKVVSQQQIALDSMENVLATTGWRPDFIKVDAEGADLEILKGAQKYLQKNSLAVFVEVSFVERYKGAAFFTDTDVYMRGQNYMLMDLYLERWVRNNAISNLFSRHQLIWGNA